MRAEAQSQMMTGYDMSGKKAEKEIRQRNSQDCRGMVRTAGGWSGREFERIFNVEDWVGTILNSDCKAWLVLKYILTYYYFFSLKPKRHIAFFYLFNF